MVLALGSGVLVWAGTGSAQADTTVITPPPDSEYFFPTFFESLGDLVVDGVHQRVIATDPTNGVLASTSYTGENDKSVGGLPGVAGLALSADSGTLYAAVPGAHAVVAYSTSTLAETARFDLGADVAPREVVVAGGRIWFTYLARLGGAFGSIDPATSAVTLHQWPSHSLFSGSPHIAAAGDRIAISSNSDTDPGGYVGVFDVAGGVEQQVALTSVGLTNIRGLAVSADGSEILAAGVEGVLRLSSTDLSSVGTYHLDGFGDVVAADAAGRVAVANRTAVGTPDLYTYVNGATTADQIFDMPQSNFTNHFGPDQIMDHGVAWQPGGPRLFIVTDNNGVIGFRALDEPAATTIKLTAPATAPRAAALTITGTISGSVPAGSVLTVRRTDMEAAGQPLADVTTDDAGAFRVTDAPPAGGAVSYTIAYAGDDAHLASSATAAVTVSRAAPALTVNRNGSVNAYGATVTMTAHLGSTHANRTVELWADPYGSDQANRLLKRAAVDGSGNLTVSLKLTRDTVVTAIFTGDSWFLPSTVRATLYTRVSVTTTVTKQYKTNAGYYYFHKTRNPVFTTTMTPYAKRKQRLVFESYSAGKWHTWKTYTLALTSAGKSTYTLTGAHSTGVKYRVRAAYLTGSSGDTLNYTTYGSYRYFTFTK